MWDDEENGHEKFTSSIALSLGFGNANSRASIA